GAPLLSLEKSNAIARVERLEQLRAGSGKRVIAPLLEPALRGVESVLPRGIPNENRHPVGVEQRPYPLDHRKERRSGPLDIAQRARDLIEHLESGKRPRKIGRGAREKGLGRLGLGLHGLVPRSAQGSPERIGRPAVLPRRRNTPRSSALVQSAEGQGIFSGGSGAPGGRRGRAGVRLEAA